MDFSLTDAQQEIARLAGQLLADGKIDRGRSSPEPACSPCPSRLTSAAVDSA
jgi:hypothetical protein